MTRNIIEKKYSFSMVTGIALFEYFQSSLFLITKDIFSPKYKAYLEISDVCYLWNRVFIKVKVV